MTLITEVSKVPCVHLMLTPEAQISLLFALWPAVFEIQVLEMHWMTPECPWAVKCQKYPVYTEYSPPRPKFHYVSLYGQPFSRYRFFENQKCTIWPQNDLKHLSVKSTLCTPNIHPRGPNFNPFRSASSYFRDTGLSKTKMHRMTPEWP